MKTAVRAALVLAVLGLTACATATPYQPSPVGSGYNNGYTDTRIEDGRYRVTFGGNTATPRQTVEDYLLYHAADLTLAQGYDWFEVIKRNTDEKKRTVVTNNDPFMDSFSWRFYGRRGWGMWGAYGFNDVSSDVYEYSRFEASAEILMHKGAKPEGNPSAYDARSVKSSLESRIVRPAVTK